MKLEQEVLVKNYLGLHARPAALIVKLLENAQSEVYFTCNNQTVNAKSMMDILLLAAKKNAKIHISVAGDDAQPVIRQLVQAFDDGFGE